MNRDEQITRAVEPLFVTIEQIKYLFDEEDYLKSRVYNKYVAAVEDRNYCGATPTTAQVLI